ncbi:Zn-dependent protease with chaperone function [Actinokineospora diospyrosa]|uniref:Zn-dependent protease with chaperone function n=2 Tax=Actinokineospora diospyrosa TaxID=103728 RepID=A0ABT1IJC4_9PSEU|nr:Zn-dependent protease with chaperone function [Actinokineospora diospyrosa]
MGSLLNVHKLSWKPSNRNWLRTNRETVVPTMMAEGKPIRSSSTGAFVVLVVTAVAAASFIYRLMLIRSAVPTLAQPIIGPLVLVALGGIIYFAMPFYTIWKLNLGEPPASAESLIRRIHVLAEEAGLIRPPEILASGHDFDAAQVIGTWRRPRLVIHGQLSRLWRRDRDGFDAVVRHELGHILLRDVSIGRKALAIAVAYPLVAILPHFFVVGLDDLSAYLFEDLWRLLALSLAVHLAYLSVMRTRELNADAVSGSSNYPLGMGALVARQRPLIASVFAKHPAPHVRLEVCQGTRSPDAASLWQGVLLGAAIGLAVFPMLSSLRVWVDGTELHLFEYTAGGLLAGVLFAAVVAPVVGANRRQPWTLGGGMVLGVLIAGELGVASSFEKAGRLGERALLVEFVALLMLAGLQVVYCRWLAATRGSQIAAVVVAVGIWMLFLRTYFTAIATPEIYSVLAEVYGFSDPDQFEMLVAAMAFTFLPVSPQDLTLVGILALGIAALVVPAFTVRFRRWRAIRLAALVASACGLILVAVRFVLKVSGIGAVVQADPASVIGTLLVWWIGPVLVVDLLVGVTMVAVLGSSLSTKLLGIAATAVGGLAATAVIAISATPGPALLTLFVLISVVVGPLATLTTASWNWPWGLIVLGTVGTMVAVGMGVVPRVPQGTPMPDLSEQLRQCVTGRWTTKGDIREVTIRGDPSMAFGGEGQAYEFRADGTYARTSSNATWQVDYQSRLILRLVVSGKSEGRWEVEGTALVFSGIDSSTEEHSVFFTTPPRDGERIGEPVRIEPGVGRELVSVECTTPYMMLTLGKHRQALERQR